MLSRTAERSCVSAIETPDGGLPEDYLPGTSSAITARLKCGTLSSMGDVARALFRSIVPELDGNYDSPDALEDILYPDDGQSISIVFLAAEFLGFLSSQEKDDLLDIFLHVCSELTASPEHAEGDSSLEVLFVFTSGRRACSSLT